MQSGPILALSSPMPDYERYDRTSSHKWTAVRGLSRPPESRIEVDCACGETLAGKSFVEIAHLHHQHVHGPEESK